METKPVRSKPRKPYFYKPRRHEYEVENIAKEYHLQRVHVARSETDGNAHESKTCACQNDPDGTLESARRVTPPGRQESHVMLWGSPLQGASTARL